MAVPVETLTIELGGTKHAFPILSILDRRGRKPHRRKQFCLIRAIEKLTHDVHQRSSGAFANHLNACSMADAILVAQKSAVEDGLLLQAEFDAGILPHCDPPPHLKSDVCFPPPWQCWRRCVPSSRMWKAA